MCHGDNCGRIEGSQKFLHNTFQLSTDFHFAKYTFHFVSFHFTKYNKHFRHCSARQVLIVQSILVYYDSARLMQNVILLSFNLFFFSLHTVIVYYDSARLMQNLILLLFFFSLHFASLLGAVFITISFKFIFISF